MLDISVFCVHEELLDWVEHTKCSFGAVEVMVYIFLKIYSLFLGYLQIDPLRNVKAHISIHCYATHSTCVLSGLVDKPLKYFLIRYLLFPLLPLLILSPHPLPGLVSALPFSCL